MYWVCVSVCMCVGVHKHTRTYTHVNSRNLTPVHEYIFMGTELTFVFLYFSLCYIVIYMFMQHHNDTIIKTHEGRKTQEGFFTTIFLPLTLLQGFEWVVQGFACERVLETEHKLHILTPLLWPSRCVFLVLLLLGYTPSGVFQGPPRSGVAFPTTSGL